MLKGKKILLGVTGSIAAYKSILLIRLLVKEGAEVKIILTPAAKDFVSSLTLATLSKNEVASNLFDENTWANHVALGRWADIMLIAPLTCNTLAKMANGQCDNLLLATYLSAICPVVVAPAMDEDMWQHPTTKTNLTRLESFGNKIIPVANGELASGLFGDGRMAEPEEIINFLNHHFFSPKIFTGKKVLITAGPTYEAIDPVRFIGNHSSGKMGLAIARELYRQGATVTLIAGPMNVTLAEHEMNIHHVTSADEMYEAATKLFPEMDIAICAAAIADYTPETVATEKIKKTDEALTLQLKKTKDVLAAMGVMKKQNQVLVGFALETANEKEHALQKLKNKNADLMVLNSLRDEGAGFGTDTNKIVIFDRAEQEYHFSTKNKTEVAADIIDTIYKLFYA